MSAARIDHVAQAIEGDEVAAQHLLTDEFAYADMALKAAQVHATLALVEQQRIANRIALGMYTNADGSRAGQSAVTRITGMSTVEVHPEIREALGLS